MKSVEGILNDLRYSGCLTDEEFARLTGGFAFGPSVDHVNLLQKFSNLASELELYSSDNSALTGTDRDIIKNLCEEIRMHIMVVALSATGSQSRKHSGGLIDWSKVLETKSSTPTLSIRHGYGGLTYASAMSKVVVLLPRIDSMEQCFDLMAEFSNVYDYNREDDWVIDFSISANFPSAMFGMLISYQRQLATEGRRIFLSWVPEDLLKDTVHIQFIELFRLEKFGRYLFSAL